MEFTNRSAAMRFRRRLEAKEMLGGKCVTCGSREDLQFDHIDPATKLFAISDSWSRKWSEMVKELEKCQLLCPTHHLEKTLNEDDRIVEHGGGITGKKSCFCELCGPLKKEYMRLYHLKRSKVR